MGGPGRSLIRRRRYRGVLRPTVSAECEPRRTSQKDIRLGLLWGAEAFVRTQKLLCVSGNKAVRMNGSTPFGSPG